MRKWTLFLGLYFAACVLAACAAGGITIGQPVSSEAPPVVQEAEKEPAPEPAGESAGRSTLYLQVLEDLWNVDKALNENITMVGVDLSATSLTEGEQATVALLFAQRHGVALVRGTAEELAEQGYITTEDFPRWEDGCLFVLTEAESSDREVTFEAYKWRSALGAYFFTDCTAEAEADGGWKSYAVGAEMIS